ncbi:MAG TPA: hypothetical protein DGG94_17040 [Micromonosporaceae bacterium]|nr:hypothetical protein [Micromonosporaceae bacterium]HCU51477.1 hypothetical protein [Micromonosporaceae bacterium]
MTEPTRKEPRIYQADFLTELFRNPLDPAYEQSAEERAARPPLPIWSRLSRKVSAWVLLAAIGVLFAVAYQQVVRGAPEKEKVRAGLISRITQQKERTALLATQAEQLQDDVARLREQALGDPSKINQSRQIEAATGMRRVTGDGLEVRLADGPDAAVNKGHRVIDYDLQLLVNALWFLGAEAISINGHRLTALTPIRKGGEAIYVGDALVVGPYQISAIGPAKLYDDFSKSDTAKLYRVWQERPEHRFGFKITERENLVLPAAVLPDLRYAKPPAASASPTPSPSGGGK